MNYEGIGQVDSHENFLNLLLGNVANSASKSFGPSASYSWLVVRSGSSFRYALREPEDDSLQWAAAHLNDLLRDYRDMWVIVQNRRIVISATDLPDLLRKAAIAEIRKPFVLKIERPTSKTWRTAFGHTR